MTDLRTLGRAMRDAQREHRLRSGSDAGWRAKMYAAESAERQLAAARETIKQCACDCADEPDCPLKFNCLGWIAKTYLANNPDTAP